MESIKTSEGVSMCVLVVYIADLEISVYEILYDKFLCRKTFIGTTPYHIDINSVQVFHKINLHSCHRLRKYFTTKISRFTARCHVPQHCITCTYLKLHHRAIQHFWSSLHCLKPETVGEDEKYVTSNYKNYRI